MKPRLLILSDLFGFQNCIWIQNYIKNIESIYNITLYDSLELAEIDSIGLLENEIHHQFVHGGIEKAVKTLIHLEKDLVDVLAFSIGGTIAWKAGLRGLKLEKLITVSSTRLRKELKKPEGKIDLLFAENDNFNPSKNWFVEMQSNPIIVKEVAHDFYTKGENVKLVIAPFILDDLIETYVNSRVVFILELALEKLIDYTNPYNYESTIRSIQDHPNSSELDLSMYILEIANPQYSSLTRIIQSLLETFNDKNAIEDLEKVIFKLDPR